MFQNEAWDGTLKHANATDMNAHFPRMTKMKMKMKMNFRESLDGHVIVGEGK